MNAPPDAAWLQALLELLQSAQLALLHLLDALGLSTPVHGQPAWPFAHRLSGDTLLLERGQARRLVLSLVALAVALSALLAAAFLRRARGWLIGGSLLCVLAAPWPDAAALWVPAQPTSFHQPPTGFTAASIDRGRTLYDQHCAACHGIDARGHGPLAAAQGTWPPNLTGPLLWRRADGELFGHVMNGMHDARSGQASMPGFGDRLSTTDAWAVLDAVKALAAGEGLRASGRWLQPVRLPDFTVRCEGQPDPRSVTSWSRQRIRLIALAEAQVLPPLEDPRLVTVVLRPPGTRTPDATLSGCESADPAAWSALSLVAGSADAGHQAQTLAGTQLISDRDGWLRARSQPGASDWTEEDLLCRSPDAVSLPAQPPSGPAAPDGLSALIQRMDAEPVRFVKGGFVH